jgi:hypothetical protein
MKFKKWLTMAAAVMSLTGCNSASVVNHNLRNKADNFSVYRRFTAMNLRNNYKLLEVEGYLAIENDEDGDINITIRTGDDSYLLNYVHMKSEWTTYMVEQMENSHTDPYHYEVHWFAIVPDNQGGPSDL